MDKEKMYWQKPVEEGGNLVQIRGSEMAKEYQKRSVEARRRNKARVLSLKEFWKDFDKAGLEVGGDDIKGIDVLTFLMKKAFHDEDFELAGQYAEKLAAYQTPKLASQQIDVTTKDLTDLTDEEFAAELAKIDGEENEEDCDCDEPSTCTKCV